MQQVSRERQHKVSQLGITKLPRRGTQRTEGGERMWRDSPDTHIRLQQAGGSIPKWAREGYTARQPTQCTRQPPPSRRLAAGGGSPARGKGGKHQGQGYQRHTQDRQLHHQFRWSHTRRGHPTGAALGVWKRPGKEGGRPFKTNANTRTTRTAWSS